MTARKKQIYGALLCLGAVALLIDRFMSGPSSTAQASVLRGKALPTEVAAQPSGGPIVSVAASPFPGPLQDEYDFSTLRDVFATTNAIAGFFDGDGDGASTSAGRGRAARGNASGGTFEERHSLGAVLLGDRATFAIVNGEWLRIGDPLDGCELTSVTGTSATFTCRGKTVTLSVMPVGAPQNKGRK